MKALALKDCTRRLGAPPRWDHGWQGICHTLEICDRDGWMISAWRPTPAELARLNEGQPLFLHIAGTAHPVVALSVGEQSSAEGADD
jgi:hypothetical protein